MKRLIICFDGTWNTSDNRGAPTNVVRLARMIPPLSTDGVQQLVFYDQGVGTGNIVDKVAGGAFGEGLESHVKLAYLFLSQNYEPGDEIYIFGFSRGAFTARSLGGFIGASRGLLERDKLHNLENAWQHYRTPPEERNTFTLFNDIQAHVRKNIKIKVMGVWDTVGALGIPTNLFNTFNRTRYAFHDTALSALVENAFQALAIDEHRGPFEATLWQRPKEDVPGQIVEQVWFAGVHSDVGGGYPNSELSDLSLRWMMARIRANSRLAFDPGKIKYFMPDSLEAEAFSSGKDEKADAIKRINEKWKGPLHDSQGYYLASRLRPRMRIIGGQRPRLGSGPLKSFFRVSKGGPRETFREAIHWSVARRHKHALEEGLKRYDPPNLRVALDDLQVVEMADELTKGTSYAPRE